MRNVNITSNFVHHNHQQQKVMIDGFNNHNSSNNDSNSSRIRYPTRQTLRQCLAHNLHLRCLCLTLLIYLSMVGLFWCQLDNIRQTFINFKLIEKPFSSIASTSSSLKNTDFTVNNRNNICNESFIRTLPLICLVILYLAYIIECWHCSTRFLLLHGKDIQHIYSYLEQMKKAKPIIWWKAASYHYVHYNQSVTRHLDPYGSGGIGSGHHSTIITTSRHYNKRIDTHHSKSCFYYRNFELQEDISEKLVGLEMFPITRINIQKCFVFVDQTSAKEFDRQRSNFFRSNFKLDQYLEIREGIHLNGIDCHDCLIALGSENFRHWYCSLWAFWIFSLILLSWPLRILLEYNTAYVNYKIVKLFGLFKNEREFNCCNNNNQDNHQTRCFLPRPITIDSLCNNNNCQMAPSYSEAILLDQIFPTSSSKDDENDKIKTHMAENEIKNKLPSYDDVFFRHEDPNQSIKADNFKKYWINLFGTTLIASDSNDGSGSSAKLIQKTNLKRSITYNNYGCSSFDKNMKFYFNYKPQKWGSLQNVIISDL